jgi:hypothetical protein
MNRLKLLPEPVSADTDPHQTITMNYHRWHRVREMAVREQQASLHTVLDRLSSMS